MTQPIYGIADNPVGPQGRPVKPKARWCSHCPGRPATAVNVVSRTCECGRARAWLADPSFPGRAIWCAVCPGRLPGALDTTGKLAKRGIPPARRKVSRGKASRWERGHIHESKGEGWWIGGGHEVGR